MNEDATEGVKPHEQDPLVLLYDYFKFLTTMSLLLLGGVLSLTDEDRVGSVRQVIVIIAFLAMAGLTALSGADAIVAARRSGRPLPWWTRYMRRVSMGCMGVGTGAFLTMWAEGLK